MACDVQTLVNLVATRKYAGLSVADLQASVTVQETSQSPGGDAVLLENNGEVLLESGTGAVLVES